MDPRSANNVLLEYCGLTPAKNQTLRDKHPINRYCACIVVNSQIVIIPRQARTNQQRSPYMIVLRKMWLLIPIFFSKRQRFGAVLVCAEPLLVFSCDQSGERRNTLRRAEVTRGHTHSTPGERVNVGCFYVIQLLIYANVGVSLVIGKITMMMGHFGPLVISLSFV